MTGLAEIVYRAGVRYRNPAIFARLADLMKSQWWSRDEMIARQNETLADLLRHAGERSPFYRDYFREHGIDAAGIRSVEDLAAIPPVGKATLKDNADRIQVPDYPEKLFYSETSGSTGSPLVFYRNANWDAWHQASVMRGMAWHGVDPWDRNGYLWGYNLAPSRRLQVRVLDGLQNRFRMFSYDNDEMDRFITKLRSARFLGGYSSMVYEIAKRVVETGRAGELDLRFIRGTSEKILDSYQAASLEAFGRRITSEYGAAESGIIAFECPSGNMHLNSETTVVELQDGEIVVTNLVSHSFPVIRYLLGDQVELDPDASCACGRSHMILKEVTGRIGARILGHTSAYPSLSLYYVFKNLAIEKSIVLNYQAVQERAGALEMRLDRHLTESERAALRVETDKYFGDDLDVTLVENFDLRSSSRKKRDFVSLVDDNSG